MNVLELFAYLQQCMENGQEMAQVMIAEQAIVNGEQVTTIRDLQKSDLQFTNNLGFTAAFLQTQFDKGLVIGFIPKVD